MSRNAADGTGGRRETAGEDALPGVLQALEAGLAVVDGDGVLVDADPRFLELHGIGGGGNASLPAVAGLRWPTALTELGSKLSGAERAAVVSAWATLLDGQPHHGIGRDLVRLDGGRLLEIARASRGRQHLLVARTGAGAAAVDGRRGRLMHEVNNVLGGMLAHLYLALTDLEADHPARPWLEAVNKSAAELRNSVRRAAGDGADP